MEQQHYTVDLLMSVEWFLFLCITKKDPNGLNFIAVK